LCVFLFQQKKIFSERRRIINFEGIKCEKNVRGRSKKCDEKKLK
jgi:hypothetical protein